MDICKLHMPWAQNNVTKCVTRSMQFPIEGEQAIKLLTKITTVANVLYLSCFKSKLATINEVSL